MTPSQSMVDHVMICRHKPLQDNSPSSKNRKNNTMDISKRGCTTKNTHDDQVNMQEVHIEFTLEDGCVKNIIK